MRRALHRCGGTRCVPSRHSHGGLPAATALPAAPVPVLMPNVAVGGRGVRMRMASTSSYGERAGTTAQKQPTEREFVHELEFISYPDVPLFQVMGEDGNIMSPEVEPNVGEAEAVKMHETMVKVNVMDQILYEAQRQGRISFYMTSTGEEATHVGAASALEPQDQIYAQYREQGTLMYRGFTFKQFCDQCCSNALDPAKGRQMPIHYGSRDLNFHTISSPLTTQLPQAVGTAYALKLEGKDAVAACFFGDGAASEGDFHAGLNFAATTKSPVVFFCRNNGYAISTSIEEQMAGDGIVCRGPAYGVPATRVDGNDIWAVRAAVAEARSRALTDGGPVLVEAITYRVGHHSTSDDSLRYRQQGEMQFWKEQDNPIVRMRQYLTQQGWYSEEREQELRATARKEVLAALVAAEKEEMLPVTEMFEDVYDELPLHLREQKAEVEAFVRAHGGALSDNAGH